MTSSAPDYQIPKGSRPPHEIVYVTGYEGVCSCGAVLNIYGLTRSIASLFGEHLRKVREAEVTPSPEPKPYLSDQELHDAIVERFSASPVQAPSREARDDFINAIVEIVREGRP